MTSKQRAIRAAWFGQPVYFLIMFGMDWFFHRGEANAWRSFFAVKHILYVLGGAAYLFLTTYLFIYARVEREKLRGGK